MKLNIYITWPWKYPDIFNKIIYVTGVKMALGVKMSTRKISFPTVVDKSKWIYNVLHLASYYNTR